MTALQRWQSDEPELVRAAIGPVLLLLLAFASSAAFWAYSNYSPVTLPALAICFTLTFLAIILYYRLGAFPLADLGFICATATCVYVALPVLFYVLGGASFSPLSDLRLQLLQPSDSDIASFGWDGFFYIVSLSGVYLLAHRGGRSAWPKLEASNVMIVAALIIVGCCIAFLMTVERAFSVSLVQSNQEIAEKLNPDLPHFVAQLVNVVLNVSRLAKVAVVVFLVVRSRHDIRFLHVLLAWILIEALWTVWLAGPRTPVALLVLSSLMAYHRYVRPIATPIICIFGVAFIGGILGYGYYRDLYASVGSPFSAATEFQALMATALHIKIMAQSGDLGSVPWQVQWAEFINFLPQQIAPFQKIDPSNWYLSLLGDETSGLMFGVMSQAAIGFGRAELVFRGAILGIVLALIHNKASRARGVMGPLFYIWIACLSYYTYRASTFYLIAEVVLYFVPFALAMYLIIGFLRRLSFAPE